MKSLTKYQYVCCDLISLNFTGHFAGMQEMWFLIQ